jgi:predicted dehydrogenase
MTVRIGLIGCGGVAAAHVHGYRRMPGRARVSAVADVVVANARQVAQAVGGARVHTDYRELISSGEVDAVDICLPHHLHVDAILAAADAGLHVLCEKPLCTTLADADRIAEAVAANGITLMCAHNQLYLAPVRAAAALLGAGALGRVYEIRTSDVFLNRGLLDGGLGWRADLAAAGGGQLIDSGYHPVYLLLHLAASEAVEVVGLIGRHRFDMAGEDSAHVLVRFADGSVGSVVTSWAYLPTSPAEKFAVLAERGTLWSDGEVLHRADVDGTTTTTRFPPEDPFTASYDAEVVDFVRCLEEGDRPVHTAAEGTRVLEVILAAYTSARERRVVAVAER